MKKKIPLSRQQGPLQSPFADLSIEGLREGPLGASFGDGPEFTNAVGISLTGERPALRLERAGRGGKTVIVLSGFSEAVSDATLDALFKSLRKSLGLGGTRHGREIELNASDAARIRTALEKLGARPRGHGVSKG